MSEWREMPIGELMAEFHDGPHATPKPSADGPVFLGIKNLTDAGNLDLSAVRHIAPIDFTRWTKRVTPQQDDIVFTYEATLHRYALIPRGFHGCLGRRLALIRPHLNRADPRYLHQALRSPAWRSTVEERVISGATVDRIPLIDFQSFPIRVPSLGTQRRIAAVLAAFDELIAINERRIELLEDLARSLYREWFVRFRFPGWDSVTFTDTPIGSAPAEWQVDRLGKFVITRYGFTASATTEPVGPRFLRGMDINKRSYTDWSEVPYCKVPDEQLDRFRLDVGDVCVVRMADPGKVGIVERPIDAVFASYLVRMRSADARLGPQLLAHYLRDARYQDWVTGSSTGTTRKSASASVLTEPLIALPPIDLAGQFERKADAFRSALNSLVEQNAALAHTRDLLLPRLVTGRLDISDVDLAGLLSAEFAA